MPALARLQHILEEDPGAPVSLGVMVGCLVAPTLVRWALQPLLGEALWFATYYPAVLVATLALGWRLGLVALAASAVLADFFFIPPQLSFGTDKIQFAAVVVFILSGGIIVLTAALLRQAVRQLNQAAETQRALNRELQHRVNNNLTVVQALAAQGVRSNPEPTAFYEAFRGRLVALSEAQGVLSSGDWQVCTFPDLPEAALRPFLMGDRVCLEGPPWSVSPEACVPLVLALHELGTNAAKYGALSAPGGRVLVRWAVEERGAGEDVVIQWSESGGPPVKAPMRRGLGSRLLRAQPGIEAVDLEYAADGVRCRIVVKGAGHGANAGRTA